MVPTWSFANDVVCIHACSVDSYCLAISLTLPCFHGSNGEKLKQASNRDVKLFVLCIFGVTLSVKCRSILNLRALSLSLSPPLSPSLSPSLSVIDKRKSLSHLLCRTVL